jgi:hypothetical protein
MAAPSSARAFRVAFFTTMLSLSGFGAQAQLPDPALTPGALNPAVAQDTIASTICARGWTRTIRPSQSYTQALKRQGIAAYGYADKDPRDYQEDHLIPLELGGDAADPHNLWPQLRFTSDGWNAEAKDRLERRLHALVCRGMVPLAVSQRAIAIDWVGTYRRYVGTR